MRINEPDPRDIIQNTARNMFTSFVPVLTLPKDWEYYLDAAIRFAVEKSYAAGKADGIRKISWPLTERMTMDIQRKEAVDNLKVAIQATLLVIPQKNYRVWAHKYLKYPEPTVDMGSLADMAEDAILNMGGWLLWTNLGRARECWYIVRTVNSALERFADDDYHTTTMFALDAAQSCLRISKASERYLLQFVQDLEKSLHGEALTTS